MFGDTWEFMALLSAVVGVLVTTLSTVLSLLIKQKSDHKISAEDTKAAKEAADLSREQLERSNDVVSLMINNVSELREYYVISKRQANRAFTSTLVICVLGFVVFIVGIVLSAMTEQELALYTTISGGIVEVISGLFFWLYKSTTNQLNLYHERLGYTEKYLTAMQLAENMSPERKDETYRYIIEMVLLDNSSHIRKGSSTNE